MRDLGGEYRYLVFTDLDGSLLDHQTYSFRDSLPQLKRLERAHIPVIFTSSKTRSEIASLKTELGNNHPFIVENGAAVFIPENYFPAQPAQTSSCDGHWVYEMSEPRGRWLTLLAQLEDEFPEEFVCFYQAGTKGIVQMTSLSEAQAEQANTREYSEPVCWMGNEERKRQFVARLVELGATVLQGGRFLGVCGNHDKGRALAWLRSVYKTASHAAQVHDLAIGDSENDRAMLEVAETALLVRSPVHDFPHLDRGSDGVIYSNAFGPEGWAEGVIKWLSAGKTR